METYQAFQNRSAQTVAVINQYLPALQLGSTGAAELSAQSQALNALAQLRDDALAAYDTANNAENQGYLAVQRLTLSLPQVAEGELDDGVDAEHDLLHLLSPAYAITPRTTEMALERGKKVVSALTKINAYLTSRTPPRGPVTSGGKGAADLTASMNAQPALEQTLEDRAAEVTQTRTELRNAASALDRLNKRFYSKLLGEARTNAALATALSQILTESANLPGTLGIKSLLQGGSNGLQILLSYENGTFDSTATSTVEWQVVGTDSDFIHSAPADPSGNALGPFSVGQTLKLRTRVTNGNGTTTGSVRTLVMAAV